MDLIEGRGVVIDPHTVSVDGKNFTVSSVNVTRVTRGGADR